MSGNPNIIDKAIDYIHEHGWTKFEARDPQTGAVCAMGALWAAQGYWDDRVAYHSRVPGFEVAALEALHEEIPEGVESRSGLDPIAAFNDDPNTTLEDVLLLMKKASARLDEQSS